ncbi:MAG: reverse transcriptase family protein [Fimbriiglobus sp.]
MPHYYPFLLENLVDALREGKWVPAEFFQRASAALGGNCKGLKALVSAIGEQLPERPDRATALQDISLLAKRQGFRFRIPVGKKSYIRLSPARQDLPSIPNLEGLPTLGTWGQLADFLQLTIPRLTTYADLRQFRRHRQRTDVKRHPYRYHWLRKRSAPKLANPLPEATDLRLPMIDDPNHYRLLEVPVHRLRRAQRVILKQILNRVPTHDAAHGFRQGRSIRTHATLHTGQALVIRFDLKDFFPSVSFTRIRGIFEALGYPREVVRLLAGLCTTSLPRDCLPDPSHAAAMSLYLQPHLPQGAPTSPALANLAAFGLDCRLAALAEKYGARYSRYADDLTFSGDDAFRAVVDHFQRGVAEIIRSEGFVLNVAKTRPQSASERQSVTGLTVNAGLNIRREDYDRLKAILTNCLRHGPASQNREASPHFREQLQGKIAFVAHIHPARGAKLQAIFDRIPWDN